MNKAYKTIQNKRVYPGTGRYQKQNSRGKESRGCSFSRQNTLEANVHHSSYSEKIQAELGNEGEDDDDDPYSSSERYSTGFSLRRFEHICQSELA